MDMLEDVIDELLSIYCPEEKHVDDWDMKGLRDALYGVFSIAPDIRPMNLDALREALLSEMKAAYQAREAEIGSEIIRYLEKVVMLQVIDTQWKDHLLGMDHLKEGIGLRGYGQKDPLVEYKKEAFDVFADMTSRLSTEIVSRLFKIQVQKQEAVIKEPVRQVILNYNRGAGSSAHTARHGRKIGRNDPCPCGSGKKYKKCCGINA
jgi:preprotein translocase subunit SecA